MKSHCSQIYRTSHIVFIHHLLKIVTFIITVLDALYCYTTFKVEWEVQLTPLTANNYKQNKGVYFYYLVSLSLSLQELLSAKRTVTLEMLATVLHVHHQSLWTTARSCSSQPASSPVTNPPFNPLLKLGRAAFGKIRSQMPPTSRIWSVLLAIWHSFSLTVMGIGHMWHVM